MSDETGKGEKPSRAAQERETGQHEKAVREVAPTESGQHALVSVGINPGTASKVTLQLAHHLDVDADDRPVGLSGGVPVKALRPGDEWTGERSDADALVHAGWVLGVDPAVSDQVRAVLG